MAGRYKAYPEYRDSGVEWVGDIPSTWNVKPLFATAEANAIKNFDGSEDNVLSLSYGRIVRRDVGQNVGLLPESFNTYQIIEAGDLVLRLTDLQNDKRSLRVGHVKEHGIITSAYLRLAAKAEQVDDCYLYRLLHSYDTTKVFYGMGGGLRQSMKFDDMRRLDLLLPSLPEQKQIARFLDHETAKIDRLIAKQQELIALLKEKRQAVISHAVTKGLNPNAKMKDSGVEWLGQVPEGWEVASLKFYAQVIDCKHITAEFLDTGYPLASIGEVKGWKVDLSNAKHTSPRFYNALIEGSRKPTTGDIIYSRNATVGEAALVTAGHPDFAMGQDVCLIRLSKSIVPEYALHALKSGLVSQQLDVAMIGSTFKRINVDDIRGFTFTIPPVEEQAVIVEKLKSMTQRYDDLLSSAEGVSGLLQERRTALISAAVTGKIDVRDWTAPAEPAQQPADHDEKGASNG